MVLVVIGDFYIVGVSPIPAEANAVLVVDPDAILPVTVSLQCFELVARREAKFGEGRCG